MLLLSGCVLKDVSDLEARVEEIAQHPAGYVEPLPEIKTYEVYTYKAEQEGKKDPFISFFETPKQEAEAETSANKISPEMRQEITARNREELEQFELDSLRMVGTLEDKHDMWGIVLAPDGIVRRVRVGNYMGLNVGKVTNISEDKIELREIFKDSSGVWGERYVELALIEE